jgi:hypothetical protein
MSDNILQKLSALCDAATPGLWEYRPGDDEKIYSEGSNISVGRVWEEQDATFIVACRAVVPDLLARLAAAEQIVAVVERLRASHYDLSGDLYDALDTYEAARESTCSATNN